MTYPGNPHEGVAGLPNKRDPAKSNYLISGEVPVALAAGTDSTCAHSQCLPQHARCSSTSSTQSGARGNAAPTSLRR